jgi:hypothetical protein
MANVLVRRARETAPIEVMVIDTRVDGSDATRLVADSAGQRVLVAWPAAFGGFRFVERR